MSREKYAPPPPPVAHAGAKPYHTAILAVRAVRAIPLRASGVMLDVAAGPLEGDPGHALIPQMNRRAYEGDKNAVKECAERLAMIATMSLSTTGKEP